MKIFCGSARILTAAIGGSLFVAMASIYGCDSPATPSSPAASAPAKGEHAAEPTRSASAPTLQSPLPALSGGSAGSQPAAAIKLPDFDVTRLPAPVRAKYAELRRNFEVAAEPYDLALTIASIHYVHGKATDAANIGEQVIAARPGVVAVHHTVGLFHEKAGATDKALAAFQKAAELDPTFAAAFVRIGILCVEKDPPRALAAFRKACELTPEDARAFLGAAKVLKAQGKNEEAYELVKAALQRAPNYAEAHRDGAALCTALGRKDDAARHEERAAIGGIPTNPDPMLSQILLFGLDLRALVQAGVGLAQQGNIKDAETVLMTAIPLEEQGTMARRAMASVKAVSGKLDDAASILRSLVDADAKDAAAVFQLADVLSKQGKNDEALAQFKKAAELAPQDPRVPHLMAVAYMRMEKPAEAKAAWEAALKLAPTFEEATVGLVQIAVKANDFEAAMGVLRTALEKSPESPVLANGLAWYLATQPDDKLRNGAEAVKLAEIAVRGTQEKSHEFLDTLACAYAEVGRFDDAKRVIEKAIKLATEAKNEPLVAQYKSRVACFEQKKPFRDEKK